MQKKSYQHSLGRIFKGEILLPAEPLYRWIDHLITRYGQSHTAHLLGLKDRDMRRILEDRPDIVTLTWLDKRVTEFGDPGMLYELYPELYENVEAA